LSFFDDGEETEPRPSERAARPRTPSAAEQRPQPRRPHGPLPIDRHTVMVRRRAAFVIGVVLLLIIILVVNGCLKSEKQQALRNYSRSVSQLGHESDEHVTGPLFTTLTGAGGKSALNVEVQIDQLRIQAQSLVAKAKGLNVPGEMAGAQRYLLQALNLRVEALSKIAALMPTALGGQGQQAFTPIAGDMEIFLASDVLFSQRIVPLVMQELSKAGIHNVVVASSRSLPNLGWLEPSTVQSRITGQAANTSKTPVSGNHGSSLVGVSAGGTTLEGEPTINHISGGANPTFTAKVENSGEVAETNVKADVTVTASGKEFKASHAIEKTEPGKTVSVDIPVSGVPLNVAAKIEVNIEGVPGENDLENNKGTFLAIFSK
jgi:hypothetical protein